MYQRHDVKLSENQIKKIIRGIESDVSVTIRLGSGTIPTYLMLTKTDINHLSKSSQIHLSKTQLKNNKHLLKDQPKTLKLNPLPIVKDVGEDIKEQLERYKQSLTVDELYEIIQLITDLLTLKEAPQDGEGILSLALSFIKTSYVNKKVKASGITTLVKDNEQLINDGEIAEELNNFFPSTFTVEDLTNVPDANAAHEHSIANVTISRSDVAKQLKKTESV